MEISRKLSHTQQIVLAIRNLEAGFWDPTIDGIAEELGENLSDIHVWMSEAIKARKVDFGAGVYFIREG